RREIGSMRPLARAIEVLPEPALVALHDVVAGIVHGAAGRQRERQEPEHGGLRHDGEPAHGYPGHFLLLSRGEEIDRVAAPQQFAHEAGSGRLDAAVKGQRATDERELHGRADPRAITRSTSGKSLRRAAAKLPRRGAPPPFRTSPRDRW